jgi:hypothetical protein
MVSEPGAPLRAVVETKIRQDPQGPPIRVDVLECGHELVRLNSDEDVLMRRCSDCRLAGTQA